MSTSDDTARPVALVAGGSRGLGLLIARELGGRGYQVVICARSEPELIDAVTILNAEGHHVTHRVCDVGDAAAVDDLVGSVELEIGPIEVMICVAGIIQVGPLAALERAHFDDAIATMLWGPVNTGLATATRMQGRGRGRIGIITSVGGLIAAPHLLPYSTAKFGAVGFSRGLRSELAGTGVTVTTVAPGLMRTGSHLRALFVGDHPKEYAWFGVAASLPLLSIDADRAAARIVAAVCAGRSVLILTPLARLAPKVDALMPRMTSALLGATTRLLPKASAAGETITGASADAKLTAPVRRWIHRVSVLGRRAAARNNEIPAG